MAEQGLPHPPNLPQFVAACRQTERPRELHSDHRLLAYHSGVSTLVATGRYRIDTGHPEYREGFQDPYSLPGRPKGMGLVEYLQTVAPADQRAYCRAGIEWTRRHKAYALPGFRRLLAEIELSASKALA